VTAVHLVTVVVDQPFADGEGAADGKGRDHDR